MIALDKNKHTVVELSKIVALLVKNQNALILKLRGDALTEEEQSTLHEMLHDEEHI
jgi:hypothetical protein